MVVARTSTLSNDQFCLKLVLPVFGIESIPLFNDFRNNGEALTGYEVMIFHYLAHDTL